MVKLNPGIIGAVTGIIGTLTGVSSLIWHINKNKPKLKLERAHFVKDGFGPLKPRGSEIIGVEITLRNRGFRSTTIEDLDININHFIQEPPSFKPTRISGNSSIRFTFNVTLDPMQSIESEKSKEIEFGISLSHTFGVINKKGITDFSTGYFTLM